jgi:MFS family permease
MTTEEKTSPASVPSSPAGELETTLSFIGGENVVVDDESSSTSSNSRRHMMNEEEGQIEQHHLRGGNCCSRCCYNFRALLKRPSTYPYVLFCTIILFLNADNNLIAPNLTQIAREFNLTNIERDKIIGGDLSFAFFSVGCITTLFVGYYADKVNRVNLFVAMVMLGEFACLMTIAVTSLAGLFVTRTLTGVSIGASIPLIFSLMGDYYPAEERARAVAFLSVMTAIGILSGQLIASTIGDAYGWRVPFVIVAIPTLVIAPIIKCTVKEPKLGAQEMLIQQAASKQNGEVQEEFYTEKINLQKLKMLGKNKTFWLSMVQAIPGCIPFGVVFTFLQDFLVQDLGPLAPGGITVPESSTAVLAFGVGSAIGMIVSGFLADHLWKLRYEYVPMQMATTVFLGAFPFYLIVNGPPMAIGGYAGIMFPAGLVSAMGGIALKSMLLNIVLPETRGSCFAMLNLFNDLGTSLGPVWASLLIESTGGDRFRAFVSFPYIEGGIVMKRH